MNVVSMTGMRSLLILLSQFTTGNGLSAEFY